MDRTVTTAPAAPLSRLNKAGLVLAFLLGLFDATGFLWPTATTSDGRQAPPFDALMLGTVLGVITMVAAVIAWRTHRRSAFRVAAAARIISARQNAKDPKPKLAASAGSHSLSANSAPSASVPKGQRASTKPAITALAVFVHPTAGVFVVLTVVAVVMMLAPRRQTGPVTD